MGAYLWMKADLDRLRCFMHPQPENILQIADRGVGFHQSFFIRYRSSPLLDPFLCIFIDFQVPTTLLLFLFSTPSLSTFVESPDPRLFKLKYSPPFSSSENFPGLLGLGLPANLYVFI